MWRWLSSFCIIVIFFFSSCTKQTENYTPAATAQSLFPLQVGKTFLYRLDSTVTANFNSELVTKSYLAKDTVESTFKDGAGNTCYRIFRYLNDTLGAGSWNYAATYIATVKPNAIEYLDEDLKFIPLTNPVSANTSWNGNAGLSTTGTRFSFFYNWNYQYININQPFTNDAGKQYSNCYTVLQIDDQSSPIFDPNNVFFKTYSVEVYANNIGLVYKNLLHINYQVIIQNGSISQRYYVDDDTDATYGIKLSLISYK